MDAKLIEATRAIQGLLTSVEPTLKIDGHWGSFTEQAFQKSSASTKMAVEAALKAYGTSPTSLKKAFDIEKLSPGKAAAEKARAVMERGGTQATGDVQKAIAAAAAATGVPVAQLAVMARIESSGNPMAVNGSSKGLLQIQPDAWDEGAKWLKGRGIDVGSYAQNVFDADKNALVGAAYLRINSDRLRRLGYSGELSPAVLYLAHQQGAGGFVELWTVAQGRKPTTNYVTEKALKGNAPPDGKGITLDKGEFYRRWMAVAQKKFG